MVTPMVFAPRNTRPSTTSAALMMNSAPPTFSFGQRLARMMETPLVPPMAKWLGVLNRWMPTAVKSRPRFRRSAYTTKSFVANLGLWNILLKYSLSCGAKGRRMAHCPIIGNKVPYICLFCQTPGRQTRRTYCNRRKNPVE